MKLRAVFCLIMFALFINACATREFIALAPFSQKTFKLSTNGEVFLLYVTHGARYTFALFDILGAPVVHREFGDNGFKNARFLPPDSQYDDVFYRILTMIKNGENSAIFESIMVEEIEY